MIQRKKKGSAEPAPESSDGPSPHGHADLPAYPANSASSATPAEHSWVTSPNNLFRLNTERDEQPRQILVLTAVACLVAYWAFHRQPQSSAPLGMANEPELLEQFTQSDVSGNLRTSLLSVSTLFIAYCCLNVKDSLLVRPHPMFWRAVHGCVLLYLLGLAALIVLNVDDARSFLKLVFRDDVQAIPDEIWNMQKDCSVTQTTLWRQFSSIWFVSHALGWFGKMLMLRDWRLCWIQSIGFELMEISLQFMIPDFRECWWDSVFIDTFGANFAGMLAGAAFLRYMKSRNYNWSGYGEDKKGKAPVKPFVWKFFPFSWSSYHWGAFATFRRFLLTLPVIIMPVMFEVNSFFLMQALWLKPGGLLIPARMILLFLMGMVGFAEFYQYTTDPHCNRIGATAWLAIFLMIMELLTIVKFSTGMYPHAPPPEIYLPWLCFLALFCVWLVLWFKRKPEGMKQATTTTLMFNGKEAIPMAVPVTIPNRTSTWWLDALLVVSFVPLFALCRLWAG